MGFDENPTSLGGEIRVEKRDRSKTGEKNRKRDKERKGQKKKRKKEHGQKGEVGGCNNSQNKAVMPCRCYQLR